VPEQPLNLVATAISDSSVRVSWMTPETSSESIESFEVYYSPVAVQQVLQVGIAPSRTFCVLQNLAANTLYSVKVSAKSSLGEGASTAAVQVLTLEAGLSCILIIILLSAVN